MITIQRVPKAAGSYFDVMDKGKLVASSRFYTTYKRAQKASKRFGQVMTDKDRYVVKAVEITGKNEYYFDFVDGNGTVLVSSIVYPSPAAARAAIDNIVYTKDVLYL